MNTIPHISKDTFVEILQDNNILHPDDLVIFQTMYSLANQEASATDLARIIGWSDKGAVIGRIVGLGKRVLTKYDIEQRKRDDGSKAFWDFFFTGYYKGAFFIYQLKPELKAALEECGLVDNIKPISLINSFLFVWNPAKWEWTELERNIEELQNSGKVTLQWSCRSFKTIRPGDRAFFVKVGAVPKGIFASGKVVSEPFLSPHWNDIEKDIPRVMVEFDVLLNPDKEPILTLDNLDTGILSKQTWTPQSSGISIRLEVIDALEEVWFEFLRTQNIRFNPFLETISLTKTYIEGSAIQITQTIYERNNFARKECLKHYGYSCVVCNFNFESYYGNIGYKFIHVHHLNPVSTIRTEYEVNPIEDLRPVCPNCHSMLHKENPPITIEELKELIKHK